MFPISTFRMQTLLWELMLICCSQWTFRLRILETKCTWSGLENLPCYSVGAFVFFNDRELILSDVYVAERCFGIPDGYFWQPPTLYLHTDIWMMWSGQDPERLPAKMVASIATASGHWFLQPALAHQDQGPAGTCAPFSRHPICNKHVAQSTAFIMGKSLVQSLRKKRGHQARVLNEWLEGGWVRG